MDEAEKQLDELCFQYGIELDDVVRYNRVFSAVYMPHTPPTLRGACRGLDAGIQGLSCLQPASLSATSWAGTEGNTLRPVQTSEAEMVRKELGAATSAGKAAAAASEEIIYKIDIPANRYDMLCLEGIARALNVFRETAPSPQFSLADMSGKAMQQMSVERETALIRPFVVAAVLRGVSFDKGNYDSFIDLQDKLHQNLCRQRSLVAIGTHDLDTIQARSPGNAVLRNCTEPDGRREGRKKRLCRGRSRTRRWTQETSPLCPSSRVNRSAQTRCLSTT